MPFYSTGQAGIICVKNTHTQERSLDLKYLFKIGRDLHQPNVFFVIKKKKMKKVVYSEESDT